jgi:hypothetical protein
VPAALRRFAWWSFFVTQAGLVLAGSAYVGVGTPAFWLMLGAAALASVAYVAAVRATRSAKPADAAATLRREYWSEPGPPRRPRPPESGWTPKIYS